jgi:hypothetical protein
MGFDECIVSGYYGNSVSRQPRIHSGTLWQATSQWRFDEFKSRVPLSWLVFMQQVFYFVIFQIYIIASK